MKWSDIKKHLLTGVSYMIPLVVASGLCMAIAKLLGGALVGDAEGTIPWMINSIGSAGMGLVVPVITAYIAYSIADRPGIAPGLICGMICANIKAGFLGGIVAAFFVGYLVLTLKKAFAKAPKAIAGLVPVLIIPLIVTLVVGLVLYLLLGAPIAALQSAVVEWMKGMQGGSKFTLGALIGAMMGFDLGGPVNKTASLFCNALLAEGIYGPTAAKIIGGMTPALGVALAAFISRRKKFLPEEMEAAKAAFPLGLCFITEGVLPFALADPLRVIPSTMAGSAVASGLSMMWGVTCTVPHGGIFVVPIMEHPMLFLLALVIGSAVTAAILVLLKPTLKEDAAAAGEKEVSVGDLDMNF
ncbi:PTS fructose transporter subunit IIC [Marasmitruncus massiliensis]|uniref:PTS fructose transporter subunit IIC n=1 Tax=Marasmitruncus massiliensis TaxID=1944642 RepID=UPI000C7DD617|nr:PTS fructose transporter subunit IIC [Marasmitruncus massiliensis]